MQGRLLAGRFEILREAAKGAIGTVYRAEDRTTRQAVAVKFLDEDDPEMVERFVREAAILSRLDHRGIVKYVSHGFVGSRHYIVMEWVEGETLAVALAREGLTADESIRCLRAVAEALAVAHAHGVVHRDIKPSNLMLVDGACDRVKILDFGVARHAQASHTLTSSGVMIGTMGYMAPEQALGTHGIDARVDVFALGCVLYQCLTGHRPFAAESFLAVRAKLLHTQPPSLHRLAPELPASVEALLGRLLAKRPADRLADAAAVATQLAALEALPATPRRAPAAPRLVDGDATVDLQVRASPAPPDRQSRIGAPRDDLVVDPVSPLMVVSLILVAPDRDLDVTLDGDARGEALRPLVEAAGGRLDVFADGAVIASLSGRGSHNDEALRAARLALALRSVVSPATRIVLTTDVTVSESALHEATVDRGALALGEGVAGEDAVGGIWLDELTAEVIGDRLPIRPVGRRFHLVEG